MSDDFSEPRRIHWMNHVVAPVMVIAIVGIGGFLLSVNTTLAEVETRQEQYTQDVADLKKSADKKVEHLGDLIESQHETEIAVKQIEIRQEHFKSEIEELKQSSNEILRILREDR